MQDGKLVNAFIEIVLPREKKKNNFKSSGKMYRVIEKSQTQ